MKLAFELLESRPLISEHIKMLLLYILYGIVIDQISVCRCFSHLQIVS